MKIIFIGAYETADFGGINSYVLNLSIQLEKFGHQCMAIRLSNRNYSNVIQGIRFINIAVKGSKMGGASCYPKAIDYIIKNDLNPDVVVFQSYFLAPYLDWKLKHRGIKVCYIQHSFACDNPKNNIVVNIISQTVEMISSIWAKNIITVGDNMCNLIKKRLHLTPAIVRGGIFMPVSTQFESDILKRHALKEDEFYLTIARIDPVKNLHILINGFKAYKGNKKLVIGGNINNSYGQEIKRLAEEDSRIKFVGPVLGADKDTLLRHCFAYCMVSSSEGFPISLLEAMSYGKRCICSDIKPNIEALGKNLGNWCNVGSVKDITQSMTDMENDMNRIEKEKQIKNRVEMNFTWESSAKAFIEYITTI